VVPWLVLALGLGLSVAGAVVFAQGRSAFGDHRGLEFLSPEQFARIESAPARMWAGVAAGTAGLLLLGGLAGRSLRRRRGVHTRGRVVLLGAAGGLLLVAGVVALLTTAPEPVVTHTGSYEPLGCTAWPSCDQDPWPGWLGATQQAGLGVTVVGAVVLAVVSGSLPAGDLRADQR
jgi:hypothetical protein